MVEEYEYKTEILYHYMKKRSKVEKQEWGLSKDYLEKHFKKGIRSFFGVELSDDGFIMDDYQQPHKGFLLETMKEYWGRS